MSDLIDFHTLVLVFSILRVVQAIGLTCIWLLDRRNGSARDWAVGSLLIAAGAAVVSFRDGIAADAAIIASNMVIFAGIIIFNRGIATACSTEMPQGLALALFGGASAVMVFATVIEPQLSLRVIVLSVVIIVSCGYGALAAMRTPPSMLRNTQRLIALLLSIEAVVAAVRAVAAYRKPMLSVLQPDGAQIVFMLVVIATTVLTALCLAILTSQKIASLLDTTLNNMHQGVAMFDREQRLIVCNERYPAMYGLSSAEVRPGTALKDIVRRRIEKGIYAGPTSQDYMSERTAPVIGASVQTQRLSDGRSIVITRQPIAGTGWVTTHEDVTDRQRIEAQIAHMARHDPLTDLANRILFLERMDQALARLRRNGEAFVLLLLDLDRFKAVNDSFGHPAGDALLKAVAQRLKACIREIDTVARLGGDEFAVILAATANPRNTAATLAMRLLAEICRPYDVDGRNIVIGTSIGVAIAPDDGTGADQLMTNADLALYRSKSSGESNYRFYDQAMDADIRARHAIELAFRNSRIGEDFDVEYQAIVDIRTRRACGAEALVRWRHPQNLTISPAHFIGVAEETGLISPLGKWILNRACADAALWPEMTKVAVNLSPSQFGKGDLVDIVAQALAASGLPARRLELEITESTLMQKNTTVLDELRRLKELGVSIALDDFGTGYSSLNYLMLFPFDRIKIDKSFVDDVARRDDCAAVLAAIAGLARSLGIATTAEGVEHEEQFALVQAAGCSQVQGFLFARPVRVQALAWPDPAAEANSAPHSKVA